MAFIFTVGLVVVLIMVLVGVAGVLIDRTGE